MRQKRNHGSHCAAAIDVLEARGWPPGLTPESYATITAAGFRLKNLPLAFVTTEILVDQHPMSLRQLLYALVSKGWVPGTEQAHYNRLKKMTKVLRERGVVPFAWMVDDLRSTLKPSSWSGLEDFANTVRDAYRRDFWASLPAYVHIFVEKAALAATLQPVTTEYDVAFSPIRGDVSISFAHEIAEQWNQIEKPIFAYYLGDHDPRGLQIEIKLREKLSRYCHRDFTWERLAVLPADFDRFNLLRLAPKEKDRCTRWFRELGYEDCAELDAVPVAVLRDRLEAAILQHIPRGEWERLQHIEELERKQWHGMLKKLGRPTKSMTTPAKGRA